MRLPSENPRSLRPNHHIITSHYTRFRSSTVTPSSIPPFDTRQLSSTKARLLCRRLTLHLLFDCTPLSPPLSWIQDTGFSVHFRQGVYYPPSARSSRTVLISLRVSLVLTLRYALPRSFTTLLVVSTFLGRHFFLSFVRLHLGLPDNFSTKPISVLVTAHFPSVSCHRKAGLHCRHRLSTRGLFQTRS